MSGFENIEQISNYEYLGTTDGYIQINIWASKLQGYHFKYCDKQAEWKF
jgi:frataxin-like iron-binding protein CyaY